jgi:MFS transporter, DHA2 family, methylenomycin A resistance protein
MTRVLHRPSAPTVTLAVASAGFLMVSLDVTIVNVALPTLAHQLGASLQQLQWIVDGYALVYAAVLITGGGLGDILGSRAVFMAGLILFSIASAACALAPRTGALVAARFVQGLGAALLVPTRSLCSEAPFASSRRGPEPWRSGRRRAGRRSPPAPS